MGIASVFMVGNPFPDKTHNIAGFARRVKEFATFLRRLAILSRSAMLHVSCGGTRLLISQPLYLGLYLPTARPAVGGCVRHGQDHEEMEPQMNTDERR